MNSMKKTFKVTATVEFSASLTLEQDRVVCIELYDEMNYRHGYLTILFSDDYDVEEVDWNEDHILRLFGDAVEEALFESAKNVATPIMVKIAKEANNLEEE